MIPAWPEHLPISDPPAPNVRAGKEYAPAPQLHHAGEEHPGALLAYPAREPPVTACIVPAELLFVHRRGSRRLAAGANGP